MIEFSKSVRKQIRQIRDQAYEAELGEALRGVESGFSEWRNGDLDCFELTDLIHEFHQGPNRELFKYYTSVKAHTAAARAIAFGVVRPEDVPPEILEALSDEIERCRRMDEVAAARTEKPGE